MKYTDEQKKSNQDKIDLFNLIEISEILGISLKSTRNRISILGIKKHRTINRNSFYTLEQVLDIKNKLTKTKETIIKYYPLKTIETWEIFHSIMNINKKL